MCMSKAREWPRGLQMPGPWAAQKLQMPHPRDWWGGQMHCSSPGTGKGGWQGGAQMLGVAGIDWCITCLKLQQLL